MIKNCKNINKRKGFTLIELLAVIVILAVIALIATPLILNIVNDTRKNAAKDSAYGYIKAIENKVALSALENKTYEDKEEYAYDEIKANVKGKLPTGGLYTLKKGIVTKGTFCIDGFTIIYENSIAKVERNGCTSDDLKLPGSVKLSSNSGNYTYPNSGTFEVIENISGGTLSCETSDSKVATCTISGNTVTVSPGTKEGRAILTIISEANGNYNKAKAVYVAITSKEALLSYTAIDYSGIYDGKEHGITVEASGATITYSTDGKNYSSENPKYINVGEYKVYYKIEKDGYNDATGSRNVTITRANGSIKLEETEGIIEYNETREVYIKENISNGKINISIDKPSVVAVSVENNKILIKGTQVGKATITVTSEATDNYNRATTEYKVEVTKANNTLKLSSNSGNYTYPNSGTFEVIENISGGTLSCTSDNTKVATCTIKDNIVTVTPGTTVGNATLTIKSAETENYNEGQAAHLAITSKGTLLSYTANGYNGVYDGKEHGITVEASGATITYSTDETNYSNENPKYINVGEYKVYYKIEKEGYKDITGSRNVTITKANGSIIAPTAKSLTYNGEKQELVNAGSASSGITLQYKVDDGAYTNIVPSRKDPGTYTVYYRGYGDSNHNHIPEKSLTVTINKATIEYSAEGYSGTYDGKEHGITVEASGATITYSTDGTNYSSENPKYINVGEYKVYYKIEREGYNTATGSKIVKITKANNTLKLSSNSGNYTYPNSGTFEVTENISGGALSCTSNNTKVATCTIKDNIVTVTPGTTEGNATLTIKSAETENYNEAQVAYVATTEEGLLSYTALDYSGTYDGKEHGITVEASGATITYSTNGTSYSSENPKYTDAGKYTVYYKIEKEGYKDITGSKKVVIIPSSPVITASDSKTSGDWHNTNFTLSFSGTGYPSGIYYYYGTTENPSTRGSSVAISSETSGTTYYVKACTSDNNCSDVSNYNVKLDKTAPTINSPFSSNGLTKIMLSTNEIKEVYINNVAVNINVNDDRSGISTSKIDSCSSKKPEIAKYNENGNNKYFQMIKISDSSDKFPIAEISCTVNATDNAGNKSSKKFTSFIGNGWVVEADKWYYYNGGGKVTGWSNLYWTRQESSGEISEGYRWYYTDSVTGEMYIGWHKLEWNNVTSWYYFAEAKRADANGTSAATTIYKTKDEPIYVGEMISGWIQERSTGCWYYTNEAGRMISNQTNYSIDGKSYSFRSSGRCYSGSGCNSTCK